MAVFTSALARAVKDQLKHPAVWYCVYLVLIGAGILVGTLWALPRQPSKELLALAGMLAVLPPVALVVWITSRMPVKPERADSALIGAARWAGRLIWTGTTFAVGAYIATLLALDLDRVGTASSANQYFYGFLGLVVLSVSLIALAGLVIKSAWNCFFADEPVFCRAAVRALSSEASRQALRLRTRIWLDDKDDEPLPSLAEAPTLGRLIRLLRPAPVRGLIRLFGHAVGVRLAG